MNATLPSLRITLCVVLLLITSVLNAQTKGDTASPSGWLLLPERRIELEIHQEGRDDSSHVTGSQILIVPLLRKLTEASYTVFLSPFYLKEEIAFFREPPKMLPSTTISQNANDQNRNFLKWLEQSLDQQELDMKSLASLKEKFKWEGPLQLPWPWYHDEFPQKKLKLATPRRDKYPVLQVTLKWTTRKAEILDDQNRRRNLTLHGLTADLRLIKDTTTVFSKKYPFEGWKSDPSLYKGWEDTPAYQVAEKLIKDIRIGLSPTTKSKDTPQKRKVGNELSPADEPKVGLHFGEDSTNVVVSKTARIRPEVTFQKKADKILPAFSDELNGQNPVRIRNPNKFAVAAGVRSGKKGKNLDVPPNGLETIYIPDGKYEIYFVYSNKPETLFQGESFTLNDNGVEIQIVKVVNGNYSIRQVK